MENKPNLKIVSKKVLTKQYPWEINRLDDSDPESINVINKIADEFRSIPKAIHPDLTNYLAQKSAMNTFASARSIDSLHHLSISLTEPSLAFGAIPRLNLKPQSSIARVRNLRNIQRLNLKSQSSISTASKLRNIQRLKLNNSSAIAAAMANISIAQSHKNLRLKAANAVLSTNQRLHKRLKPHPNSMVDYFLSGLTPQPSLRHIEEETTIIKTSVPLFVFNAPNVAGSKSIFTHSEEITGSAGWEISVLGSGYGSDVSLSVIHTDEFQASSGEKKLVFLPLEILATKIAIYEGAKYVGSFIKSEMQESEDVVSRGIRSVNTQEWKEMVDEGRPKDKFDLLKDKSKDLAKYQREYSLGGTFEATFGFKAFNFESKVTLKCTASRTAKMTFELSPGHRYILMAPKSIPGFYFEDE